MLPYLQAPSSWNNAFTRLLILLSVVLIQVCHGFQLLTWPTDQVVELGGTFTLSCSFSSAPYRVDWLLNGSAALFAASDFLSSDNSTFARVASADTAGVYQCRAHYLLGSLLSVPALIQIGYIRSAGDARIDVSGHAGGWKLLSCDQVQSLPQPRRLWTKLDRNLVDRAVRTDASLYQLVNGSLLFSELSASHAGVYTCQVDNPSTQQFRRVRYNFTIIPGSPEATPLHLLLPTNLTVSTGSTAIFQCFVDSSYLSRLSWFHNGSRLASVTGYFISDDGATLDVSGAAPLHSGEYVCAVDGLGSLSASLTVLDPPVISGQETSLQVNLGERLSVSCPLERGAPGAEWSWLRNGRIVEEDGPLSLAGGSLSISRTRESDQGIYQCFAANLVGKASKAFRVEIISFPPTFLSAQSHISLLYFVRSPLLINCSANSVPPPSFSWRKDSLLLNPSNLDGAVSFPEPGILTKSHLSPLDSGDYTCSVKNSLGLAQRSHYIRVVAGILQFTREPIPQNFALGGVNYLVCEASVDSSLALSFSWFKDGISLQTNGRVSYSSPNTGTLRFESTQLSDTGRYQCRVEARDAINSNQVIDNAISSQEVSVDVLEVPGAPSGLSSSEVSQDSLTLAWSPATSHIFVSHYQIHLTIKLSNGTLIPGGTYSWPNTSARLSPLLPDTLYLIQVSAVSSEVGPWSEPPLYVQTTTGVPTASPFGLSSHQIGENSFLLRWIAPPERLPDLTGRNGEIAHYEVRLGSEQGSTPQWQFYNTSSNLTYYALTQLTPYTLYRISVVAVGYVGKSPSSPDLHVRTLASEPNAVPQNLECNAGSVTSLACQVVLPDPANRNGLIDGFLVHYKEENGGVWSTVHVLEYIPLSYLGNVREFELKELTSNTTFQLNISFINIVDGVYRAGKSSQIYTFILDQPVPGPPTNLTLSSTTYNSILANWSLPSRLNGPLIGYFLSLKVVNAEVLVRRVFLNISVTEYAFEGLDLGTDYSVSVKAISDGGGMGFGVESRITLGPGAPSPPSLEAQVSGKTVFLLWGPGATGGSPIIKYRPEYSSDGEVWIELDLLNGSATDYNTNSLPPGTFRIQVVAVNILGETASNQEVVSIPNLSLLHQLSFQVALGFVLFLLLLALISCGGGVWIFYIWRRSKKKYKIKRSFKPNPNVVRNKTMSVFESTYDYTSDAGSHEKINPQYLTEDRIVRGPDLNALELEIGEQHETPPYNLQPHILHLSPSLSSLQKPFQDSWNLYTTWNKPTLNAPPIPEAQPPPADYVEMRGLVRRAEQRVPRAGSPAASASSNTEEPFTPPQQYQQAALNEVYPNLRTQPNFSLTPVTPVPNYLLTPRQDQMFSFPQSFVSLSEWSLTTAETDSRCQTFV